LTGLPAGIGKLENLEKLDLRWNKSLTVPKWIENLEKQGCIVYI
jgi:hypothetical protein